MSYTRSFIGESEFDRQALNLDPGQAGVPLWKVYDPRSEGLPSNLRYYLSGLENSRLGRYEKSGFGFSDENISQDDYDFLWGDPAAEGEEVTEKDKRLAQERGVGTDWGSVFGTVFGFIGDLAKPAADIYMSQQARDQAKKDRKREEYGLAMEAERYSSGRSSGSQPSKKKSKTGLFIGLGVVALVSVIGVIVYVSR